MAENAEDILRHEMHHKDHWDFIEEMALTTGKSRDMVKQEMEAELRKYVQTQLASDPRYVSRMVSRNAANSLIESESLNELVAEALLQQDKGAAKDPILIKLVGEMFL